MFWQPTHAGQNVRNFARGLAHSIDKNLDLYTEYRSMIGLGARKWGHKSGMHAAAAEVLDALTEYSSFLAVFDLGTMFYLVAVRNGVILEDKVFSSAEDAREEYAKLYDMPDWNALVAPNVWGMPRAVERKLSDLMSGGVRAVLRPISRIRSSLFSALLVGCFAGVLFGIYRGGIDEMMKSRPQISKIDPELAAEYKRQIEEKNKELDKEFDIPQPVPPEPIVLPYDHLPNVKQRAQVCFQAMGFLMQPIPGWNQVYVECGEEDAIAQFKRDFSTLGEFYDSATNFMPHSFVKEKNENIVELSAVLPEVETVASQDERDAESIVLQLRTMFQGMNADADIDVVEDVLSNGVDTVNLHVVELAASSKLIPMQFMEIFNDFGGVYMTKCTWDAGRRIWNYEVIIYAK